MLDRNSKRNITQLRSDRRDEFLGIPNVREISESIDDSRSLFVFFIVPYVLGLRKIGKAVRMETVEACRRYLSGKPTTTGVKPVLFLKGN